MQNGDSEGLATLQLSELYIETGRVADGMQMLECNVEAAMQVRAAVSASGVCARCSPALPPSLPPSLLPSSCQLAERGAALHPEPAVHATSRDIVAAHCLLPIFSLPLLLPSPPPPSSCEAQVQQRRHVAAGAAAVREGELRSLTSSFTPSFPHPSDSRVCDSPGPHPRHDGWRRRKVQGRRHGPATRGVCLPSLLSSSSHAAAM